MAQSSRGGKFVSRHVDDDDESWEFYRPSGNFGSNSMRQQQSSSREEQNIANAPKNRSSDIKLDYGEQDRQKDGNQLPRRNGSSNATQSNLRRVDRQQDLSGNHQVDPEPTLADENRLLRFLSPTSSKEGKVEERQNFVNQDQFSSRNGSSSDAPQADLRGVDRQQERSDNRRVDPKPTLADESRFLRFVSPNSSKNERVEGCQNFETVERLTSKTEEPKTNEHAQEESLNKSRSSNGIHKFSVMQITRIHWFKMRYPWINLKEDLEDDEWNIMEYVLNIEVSYKVLHDLVYWSEQCGNSKSAMERYVLTDGPESKVQDDPRQLALEHQAWLRDNPPRNHQRIYNPMDKNDWDELTRSEEVDESVAVGNVEEDDISIDIWPPGHPRYQFEHRDLFFDDVAVKINAVIGLKDSETAISKLLKIFEVPAVFRMQSKWDNELHEAQSKYLASRQEEIGRKRYLCAVHKFINGVNPKYTYNAKFRIKQIGFILRHCDLLFKPIKE